MWWEASPCGRAENAPGRERKVYGERKRKQKKGFSALAVRIGLVCVCIYLCVSLVFAQIDSFPKRQQLENLTQQVSRQSGQPRAPAARGFGDEAAYMERIARDKLGYVLPGEHIYVDMSGD